MRFTSVLCGLLLIIAALLATSFARAAADDKDGHVDKHDKHAAKTVKVMTKDGKVVFLHHIQPGGGVKEEPFDLSQESDRSKLIKQIDDGTIAEIQVEQNPMKLSADLGLWALVIFLALIFILRKLAWGPMVEGLQKREQTIRQAVDEAKLAREETEKARTQFKKEMDEAFARIPAMMEKARQDGEKLADEMRTKAAADVAAERERLRREIDLAKTQLIQDMFNQTAQLATLISANVLARSITPDDQQRMLSIAMEELKSSGPRFRQDIV